MKKILYLLVLPLLVACGNAVQKKGSAIPVDSYSICVVDSVDEWVEPEGEEVEESSIDNSYSTQNSDIVKAFDVEADVYKVNTTTMEMSYRGKEDLHVTLYTNHTAYAVGREGASMQVYESTERGYDFMCAVYGNKYIYIFSTDEIQ